MKAPGKSYAGWRRLGRPRYAGVLTPRQQDVLELLVMGLTNEEIAPQLGITEDGVKYHVSQILLRLGVENRHDAVALHLRSGGSGRLAAWAPVMFLRKVRLAWLPKAAAGAVLTAAAVGIALLLWGVLSTSSGAVTTTGCSAQEAAANRPACAPGVGVAHAGDGADAISAISAGFRHSCASKGGGVWCWGGYFANDGVTPGNPVPMAVPGLTSGVSAIDSDISSCAVKDGGAWCWHGFFTMGVPVAAPGLTSGVSAFSAGRGGLTCALKDGGAWCWGSNWAGQLGNDSTTDSDVPVAVSGLASGVNAIGAGVDHVCGLKDGGVWCWGWNGNGQLGNNPTARIGPQQDIPAPSHVPVPVSGLTTGVTAISVGYGHTCALKDGGVWCWGSNSNGNLGNNSTPDSFVPVMVSDLTSGVSAITAGDRHRCAVKDGGAWCWGSNSNGQLGNDSTTESHVPVAVSGLGSGVSAISAGENHSCALRTTASGAGEATTQASSAATGRGGATCRWPCRGWRAASAPSRGPAR